ncbi:uncharacterized protein LOC119837436 [Zerene cesonia]|uniref:uncharacterized protein LOC119837436 n=1 Tax=Zerene cesonia TaxID=33412 RepID=UPI0018E5916C|nr:uncharacterized protein LOC119837436 [Zerene cesonia]
MSNSPQTPKKGTSKLHKNFFFSIQESNINIGCKNNKQQNVRNFISWYKHFIDNERQNLGLYLSDDITIQWFGRTIRTRKKVFSFLKNDVECSKHYFTSVDSIDKIKIRSRSPRKSESLSSPSLSPEIKRNGKRKLLQATCNSPEWAPGCKPDDEFDGTDRKRSKATVDGSIKFEHNDRCPNDIKCNNSFEINNKGDGVSKKRKLEPTTPQNMEYGQGDCMPSTSSDSNRSHEALNAQLPKLAVECNGYVEFTRSRNSHNIDCPKWERKFKLQISFSVDPLNVGEYIIWGIFYSDESKCRRNLLAAFDEVGKNEEPKQL